MKITYVVAHKQNGRITSVQYGEQAEAKPFDSSIELATIKGLDMVSTGPKHAIFKSPDQTPGKYARVKEWVKTNEVYKGQPVYVNERGIKAIRHPLPQGKAWWEAVR
jgi:hypothetical protein